ncbi:hypothetical protein R6Q59_031238 [Mikania micrantha]
MIRTTNRPINCIPFIHLLMSTKKHEVTNHFITRGNVTHENFSYNFEIENFLTSRAQGLVSSCFTRTVYTPRLRDRDTLSHVHALLIALWFASSSFADSKLIPISPLLPLSNPNFHNFIALSGTIVPVIRVGGFVDVASHTGSLNSQGILYFKRLIGRRFSDYKVLEKVVLIWKELGTKFNDVFGMGKFGDVAFLLAACYRIHTHEQQECSFKI